MDRMTFIQKLFFELRKNTKLIIRNWTSLLMILFSPLLLLALVGYALSGSQIHGISVGVITDEPVVATELSVMMHGTASVIRYGTIETCITQLTTEEVSLCVVMRGTFRSKDKTIPGGEVAFFYDNTRPKITLLLVNEFKSQLGLVAEQISISSAQVVVRDLNDFIGFLNARIDDIDNVEQATIHIERDLTDRLALLEELNVTLSPHIEFIHQVDRKLTDHKGDLTAARSAVNNSLQGLEDTMNLFEAQLGIAEETLNQSFSTFLLKSLMKKILEQGQNVVNSADASLDEIETFTLRISTLSSQLRIIESALSGEIERTKQYLLLLEKSKHEIENTLSEAREKMDVLLNNDPSFVEKLIKPIAQVLSPLVKGVTSFQVAFGLLVSTVIIFMATIVGNILTLLEINNKARIRNILAPTKDLVFITGTILTAFIIVVIQVIVLLILGQVVFNLSLMPVLGQLVLVLSVLSLLFICVGMIIAYLAPTIESSLLFSTILSLLIFLFSDALQPIQQMPLAGYIVAKYNPLVLSEMLIRKIIFFNASVVDFLGQFVTLGTYFILAFILALLISRWKNRKI
jgi:hypothetical protein